MRRTLLIAAAGLLTLTTPALANDSEAAVGLGGIELIRNGAISMDSEDLYISKDEVRVKYRFTNRTNRDQELTISFPVATIRADEETIYGAGSIPDFAGLDFVTTVDGQRVKLQAAERALIGSRDVTARVQALGWPLRWIDDSMNEPPFVTKLTPAQRTALRREGLLRQLSPGDPALYPAWDIVTHITRKQVFPAGRTVEVTHRYAPLIGGSVAGLLHGEGRLSPAFAKHARRYCIDRQFLAGIDRGLSAARARGEEVGTYGETWISYILKSGANWRGPIGDFRLVVDKGKPENLVSFCMSGVKKISPTQFEVRRRNFEPTADLDILLIQWSHGQ